MFARAFTLNNVSCKFDFFLYSQIHKNLLQIIKAKEINNYYYSLYYDKDDSQINGKHLKHLTNLFECLY